MALSRRSFVGLVVGVVLIGAGLVWSVRRPSRVAVEVGTVSPRENFQSTVAASGEIVAVRYADVGSSVMGKIVRLAVAEGDRVKAGQVLARIDAVQAESDVSGVSAQTRALESEEQAAAEQIRAAQSDIAAAEARERDTAQQLRRKRELAEEQLIAASELDSAKATAESAQASVAAARAGLERAESMRAAASRRVAQARAQLVRANDVLSKTSIVAPLDGVVSRLHVREGEMVVVGVQNQPGTTLMTLSDLSGINAEVKVAEADVLRLSVHQRATVRLEAVPDSALRGRVVEIGSSALPVTGTGAAAREFKVVIRLEDPPVSLRPGLTCDAEIVASERKNVLTVPLQSVVLRPGEGGTARPGVFVVQNEQVTFVPVTTGIIGGLDVEVTGLAAGTPVVVGPFQALRDLQPGSGVKSSRLAAAPAKAD
jgi:HlyD family secretion protein